MADPNGWQVLNRFVRDHSDADEPVTLTATEVRLLASAGQQAIKSIHESVAAMHRVRGLPPPRAHTYEETYGEPEPAS